MHDTFLKFADGAEALASLEAVGMVIAPDEHDLVRITYHDTGLPDGMLIVKAVGPAYDGVVCVPTGEIATDDEGVEYPEMAAVPGFHVNLRLADGAALPVALEASVVTPEPATPAEIFA